MFKSGTNFMPMQNMQNMPIIPNLQNNLNMQNMQNNLNMQNMQNNLNMQNMQNMPNMQNNLNMQNMQNNLNMQNMQNLPNMQNMQNMSSMQNVMPNQYINLKESTLEELIKPYKEKIKQLEKELEEKRAEIDKLRIKLLQNNNVNKNNQQFNNNMGSQVNSQFNPMNISNNNNNMNPMNNINNFGNPMNMMNNNLFNPMNNQINQNNMMNLPNNQFNNNIVNNPMFQMCNLINNNNISPMLQNEIKYLSIKFRTHEGSILVQCKSDDKIEDMMNKFFTKLAKGKKEDYELFISRNIKGENSTVEENGLADKNCFISVFKKNEHVIKKENEMKNEKIINNNEIKRNNTNIQIKGQIINVIFERTYGSVVVVPIGVNNTVREAAILFCKKLDIPISVIGGDLIFLFNGKRIDPFGENTLEEICFKLNQSIRITVIDSVNIHGA